MNASVGKQLRRLSLATVMAVAGTSALAIGDVAANTASGTVSCGSLSVVTGGRALAQQRHTTTYNITFYYSGEQYKVKDWGTKPANQSWVIYSPNTLVVAGASCL